MHESIERSRWPRFRSRNRKQNPSNSSQPRVWLVRFPANPLSKQMLRPKQKALYKASGVITPQVRLSCEEKGKMPTCFTEAINCKARTATMPSPNSGAVTSRANLVLTSEVADGVISTAPVLQGTREVPIRQAGTKTPSSANHLHNKVANKAPQCASLPSSSSVKFALRSGAKRLSLGADSGAYAASALKVLPKFLTAKLKLEHYLVPITSVVMRKTRHHPMFRFQSLRMPSLPLTQL